MKELNVKANRSIERAFHVLNCYSLEDSELSINEFNEKTGLSRATLYRILKTMLEMDYLRYNESTGKYRLSTKFYELGSIASTEVAIQREVADHLVDLFKKTGHTILLATLKEDKLIYLDKRENDEGLKISSKIGKIREPDYGILGRTLISALPEKEQQLILKSLETKRSYEEMEDLKKKINIVNETGYLYMANETLYGVSGIAVPVNTTFTLSIGILFPSFQITEQEILELIEKTRKTAKEISNILS
ncbi:IclR family transcriptional regulator [Salibacterium sp. K-3]